MHENYPSLNIAPTQKIASPRTCFPSSSNALVQCAGTVGGFFYFQVFFDGDIS